MLRRPHHYLIRKALAALLVFLGGLVAFSRGFSLRVPVSIRSWVQHRSSTSSSSSPGTVIEDVLAPEQHQGSIPRPFRRRQADFPRGVSNPARLRAPPITHQALEYPILLPFQKAPTTFTSWMPRLDQEGIAARQQLESIMSPEPRSPLTDPDNRPNNFTLNVSAWLYS